MMRLSAVVLLVPAAAMLVSCATVVRSPPALDWDRRQILLDSLDRWELRGRLAYREAGGAGGQASLRWRQQGDVSRLRFSGPFGAGSRELLVAPSRVRLTDGSSERFVEYSGPAAVEDFMRTEMGWTFPAGAARFWMLAMTAPGGEVTRQFDADGRLDWLEQYGWRIDFLDYAVVDGIDMPVRLTMESPRASVRLVVQDWQLPDRGGELRAVD